jgi:acyl-CoA dehydrogenase
VKESCAPLAAAARVAAEALAPRVLALEGSDEQAAARLALAGLVEAGLVAWTVPRRDGGADTQGLAPEDQLSVRAVCALREELARHSGMLDVMLAMQGLGSLPISLGGSKDLRRAVLPEVAAGRSIAALALTETEAGSSLAEVRTRAVEVEGGWKLKGEKTFISNAPIADFFCVLARTPAEEEGEDADATGMFYVPADSEGLTHEAFEVMAPHPIGRLTFDSVSVPRAHRLGPAGGGLELALATLARFRTTVAAAAVGFARRALEESITHLARRRQFGRPLSAFQALRFDVAEMDLRLRASQLLVAEAAEAVDNGSPATAEVARAKLHATEAASWICDRAVQHHGGLGVKRGETVERLFREVRALRIYEGSSEIQKIILAKAIFGYAGSERA